VLLDKLGDAALNDWLDKAMGRIAAALEPRLEA
jgi:hypothetical protein